jgi:hypothetical protein
MIAAKDRPAVGSDHRQPLLVGEAFVESLAAEYLRRYVHPVAKVSDEPTEATTG